MVYIGGVGKWWGALKVILRVGTTLPSDVNGSCWVLRGLLLSVVSGQLAAL